jgi:hypothetical protein
VEFDVEQVTPITWNDEVFKNLAMDPDRKVLVQSLIKSHAWDHPLDDFVPGKGLGLVINLFGLFAIASYSIFQSNSSPVTQALLAWANHSRWRRQANVCPKFCHMITSTNYATGLHKPLYVVSAGDLGTNASTLDQALNKIFALVPVWDAVVLIDEADVFLEERGAADLERNAMVSVFLRQIE